MPLNYRIDPKRRLVITRITGTLKDQEMFEYQHTVWSRPDVAGFDELVDLSGVIHIMLPSIERVRDLAELASEMGRGAPPSKLAIAAPRDLEYGLSRMFEHHRENAGRDSRSVAVFRTVVEALEWLGIEGAIDEEMQPS
jgi:hypothetical protein